MVWGFGGGGGNKVPDEPPPPKVETGEVLSPVETKYRFDSAALERAAKAAKEIEKSPLAAQILELQRTAEVTKQSELRQRERETSINLERLRHEEQRKTDRERAEQQGKINQQKAQYEDQLARRRFDDQLSKQREAEEDKLRRERLRQEEQLRHQAELHAQQLEHEKRKIDYELEKKAAIKMKQIEADYKARAVYERENSDIHLKSQEAKAEQTRKMMKEASAVIGQGFNTFITDRSLVGSTALGLTLFAGGIYGAKHSVLIAAKAVASRIFKPNLVTETSRLNVTDLIQHPIKTVDRIRASRRPADALKEVIFKPSLEVELRDIAIATKNSKLNRSYFSNYLFYGPPGTGKTLVARRLAQHSGMDFALFSGGDISPLGQSAVPEIHKIFDWSQTSRRGLLIFIDEADSFLMHRKSKLMTTDLYQAMNAFLNKTGSQSNKYMFVLSSNLPEQLDSAVLDRIDEKIEFELPCLEERKRLVRQYFNKHILEPAAQRGWRRRALKVEQFDYGATCDKVAEMLEGFSGRAIAKLSLAWQRAAYLSVDRTLTEEMMMNRVEKFIPRYMKQFETQKS